MPYIELHAFVFEVLMKDYNLQWIVLTRFYWIFWVPPLLLLFCGIWHDLKHHFGPSPENSENWGKPSRRTAKAALLSGNSALLMSAASMNGPPLKNREIYEVRKFGSVL